MKRKLGPNSESPPAERVGDSNDLPSADSLSEDERLLKKLKSPDYVLDLEMPMTCKKLVERTLASGQSIETVLPHIFKALTEGYQNSALVARAASELHWWVKSKAVDLGDTRADTREQAKLKKKKIEKEQKDQTETKILDELSKLVSEKFDNRVILEFQASKMIKHESDDESDDWLRKMSAVPYWRKKLISLIASQSHSGLTFSEYIANTLNDLGHFNQVAEEAKTVEYFSIFHSVLKDAMKSVPKGNSLVWKIKLNFTGELVSLDSSSYLYSSVLLQKLADSSCVGPPAGGGSDGHGSTEVQIARAFRFRCVQQEYRSLTMNSKGALSQEQRKRSRNSVRNLFIEDLRVTHEKEGNKALFKNLATLLKQCDSVRSERERENVEAALYDNFSTPDLANELMEHIAKNPQDIKIMQEPEFFEILLTDIYHPFYMCRDVDHRDDICSILAMLSTNTTSGIDYDIVKEKLISTSTTCNNNDNLNKNYREDNMYENLAGLAFNTPIVCMGILLWASAALQSTNFWNDDSKQDADEIRLLLNLLETIGQHHRLHIPEVFRILQNSYLFIEQLPNPSVRHCRYLFLEKIVDLIKFGDPIAVIMFLHHLCEENEDGKVKMHRDEVRKVVIRLMRSVMPPFSKNFADSCRFFFMTRLVHDCCRGGGRVEESMKSEIHKFLHAIRRSLAVNDPQEISAKNMFRAYGVKWE